MKKSKLVPTLEEAFSVGKLEGQKEAIKEILDLLKSRIEGQPLVSYLKSRLKGLNTQKIDNPFGRENDSRRTT